jgi:hypothetical protein
VQRRTFTARISKNSWGKKASRILRDPCRGEKLKTRLGKRDLAARRCLRRMSPPPCRHAPMPNDERWSCDGAVNSDRDSGAVRMPEASARVAYLGKTQRGVFNVASRARQRLTLTRRPIAASTSLVVPLKNQVSSWSRCCCLFTETDPVRRRSVPRSRAAHPSCVGGVWVATHSPRALLHLIPYRQTRRPVARGRPIHAG